MTSQLVKWYKKNKAENFELIMVTGDKSQAAMLKYMSSKKVKFPAFNFKDAKIGKALGFKGYPWVIMVDEKGKQVINAVAFNALAKVEKILKK
jgi:uncharacterized protein YvpB